MAVSYRTITLYSWQEFYRQVLIALRDSKGEFNLFRTIHPDYEVFYCDTQIVKYSYETTDNTDKDQFLVLSEILRSMPTQSEVD